MSGRVRAVEWKKITDRNGWEQAWKEVTGGLSALF